MLGSQWRDTWQPFRPNGGKVGADAGPWRQVGLMGIWSAHWAAGVEAEWACRSTLESAGKVSEVKEK